MVIPWRVKSKNIAWHLFGGELWAVKKLASNFKDFIILLSENNVAFSNILSL